jgi:hypothetical protein
LADFNIKYLFSYIYEGNEYLPFYKKVTTLRLLREGKKGTLPSKTALAVDNYLHTQNRAQRSSHVVCGTDFPGCCEAARTRSLAQLCLCRSGIAS